jgi:ATP-dependent Clp protease ATP-binding subunit ClpA
MWERVKHSLKKQFPSEFLNRIDRSIMFHFLDDASLIKITEIELGLVQNRILSAGIFLILQITDAAKAYIRSKGTDPVSGARELDRVIERVLVEPISNLMAAQQVSNRDMLIVDWKEGNELTFHKLEGAVEPPPPPEYIEHAEEVPSTV